MWWIFKLFFYLLLLLVAFFLLREAWIISRMLPYKRQGFKWKYVPLKGHISLFLSDKAHPDDPMATFKEVLSTTKDCPGLVINDVMGSTAMLYLTNLDVIKEFFVKETAVSQRADSGDLKLYFSFIFDFSERGFAHRKVFADLFRAENITSNIPFIQRVAKKQLTGFLEGETGSYDFKHKFDMHVRELGKTILFGGEKLEPVCADEDNTPAIDMVFKIINELSFYGLSNPLNTIFCGLPNKLNLLSASRLATRRSKMLTDAIVGEFKRRSSDERYTLGVNILDLMIAHNRAHPDNQFSHQDIVGDMCLFMVAGTDTTSKTLSTCTYLLAQHPEVAQAIREDTRRFDLTNPATTIQDLDKSTILDATVREVLRLRSPASSSFERIITKDFKLGKYDIKAGDKVVLPYCFLSSEKGYFPGGDRFDPNNITGAQGQKVPPIANIPFSAGRRACVGKLLAETVLKVSLVELLSRYELTSEPCDESPWRAGFGIDIMHCKVKVSTVRA